MHKQNGCREKSISYTISFIQSLTTIFHRLIQSAITTLLLLPALFSCTKTEFTQDAAYNIETKVTIRGEDLSGNTGVMDIFTFDIYGSGHLDSYQHIEDFEGLDVELRSQSGDKHAFICLNGQRSMYDWAGIRSLESLDDIYIELKDERRKNLCATGEGKITAGKGATQEIEMRRMASEIVLNSIKCDFTGKSYHGKKITDARVYLTNVNCRCRLTDDGDIIPLGIINAGGLDLEDTAGLSEPDMVFQKFGKAIDENTSFIDMSFICYPNTSHKESPGTPFTRLVIEGKIDGETFWWPIDINRKDVVTEPGIHRNTRYIFDIKITRKGSSDPDEVIETDVAEVNMRIRQWTEKEEQKVTF